MLVKKDFHLFLFLTNKQYFKVIKAKNNYVDFNFYSISVCIDM